MLSSDRLPNTVTPRNDQHETSVSTVQNISQQTVKEDKQVYRLEAGIIMQQHLSINVVEMYRNNRR